MKVSELAEALKGMDPEMPILIARDAEGNGFHVFDEISNQAVDPEELENYSIEGIKESGQLTPEMEERGYCEEDFAQEGDVEVLVFWP